VFPAGGPTGDLVTSLLNDAEVPLGQVAIAESTRESFTVNESSTGQQYRFVLPGPQMTFTEQARCLDQLRMAAESAEFVVASGSLPPGVSPTSGHPPFSGHLWRRLAARVLRGVSA
jgi:6-phosphofructokinase 2